MRSERNGTDMQVRHAGANGAGFDRPLLGAGGALLRAAADGELLLPERATLRTYLAAEPHGHRRIAFEEALRAACGRAMRGETLPDSAREALRARIIEEIRTAEPRSRDVACAEEPRRGNAGWVRRHWVGLAAAIALLASVLVIVIAGEATGWGRPLPVRLASFLPGEHGRCELRTSAFDSKIVVREKSELPEAFGGLLGTAVSIEAVEAAGFRFAGAGHCAVPGPGRSVHLVFRPVQPKEQCEQLSLFVQEDKGALRLEAGQTYTLAWGEGKPPILVWARDGAIYYLVSDDEGMCEAVRTALGAAAARDALVGAL